MQVRLRCSCRWSRGFRTSLSYRYSSSGQSKADTEVIRSGGEFSYIGFGSFESFGSEAGSIQKALEYHKDVLNAHSSSGSGLEHTRIASRSHHDIAMCHHRAGDVEAAISEYRVAAGILEKLITEIPNLEENRVVLRRSRLDLSSVLSGLSVALADVNENQGALECALKALELRKSLMGPNHASVAECLNTLGGLYFRQASFNKAAEMYQESLRILLTKTGGKEENKYVALAYYNIGLTYDKLGLQKGLDAVYKALLIAEHIWGPNHDQTIQISSSYRELRERLKIGKS